MYNVHVVGTVTCTVLVNSIVIIHVLTIETMIILMLPYGDIVMTCAVHTFACVKTYAYVCLCIHYCI